jgi:CRP-like cAMP-binding protein
MTAALEDKESAFDPKAMMARIGSGRTAVKYPADVAVYAQGDAANSIFYIQKGKAKVVITAPSGKEAVLAIFGPGDFFGESCLLGQAQRMTSVVTITELSAMRLDKHAVLAALHEEPQFSELFIVHLLRRKRRVEDDLVDQLFNSSEKRLARTLLLLANFGKESRPEPVLGKMSQETLAEMVGTTRSRVSFFMNKFRRLGFIDYRGGRRGDLHVNASLLNMVLSEGAPTVKKLGTKAKDER